MYAWMKDYSVANYFLFQMNPKLVLIINMQCNINFHGNKLGPAGDFLLKKKKGLTEIFLQGCLNAEGLLGKEERIKEEECL